MSLGIAPLSPSVNAARTPLWTIGKRARRSRIPCRIFPTEGAPPDESSRRPWTTYPVAASLSRTNQASASNPWALAPARGDFKRTPSDQRSSLLKVGPSSHINRSGPRSSQLAVSGTNRKRRAIEPRLWSSAGKPAMRPVTAAWAQPGSIRWSSASCPWTAPQPSPIKTAPKTRTRGAGMRARGASAMPIPAHIQQAHSDWAAGNQCAATTPNEKASAAFRMAIDAPAPGIMAPFVTTPRLHAKPLDHEVSADAGVNSCAKGPLACATSAPAPRAVAFAPALGWGRVLHRTVLRLHARAFPDGSGGVLGPRRTLQLADRRGVGVDHQPADHRPDVLFRVQARCVATRGRIGHRTFRTLLAVVRFSVRRDLVASHPRLPRLRLGQRTDRRRGVTPALAAPCHPPMASASSPTGAKTGHAPAARGGRNGRIRLRPTGRAAIVGARLVLARVGEPAVSMHQDGRPQGSPLRNSAQLSTWSALKNARRSCLSTARQRFPR